MKALVQLCVVVAFGAIAGFALDIYIWRNGLGYPILGVLPLFISRSGEGAYDLMSIELIVQCALIFGVAWLVLMAAMRGRGSGQ